MTTLFTEFLSELGVRHTRRYADSSCRDMPFKTLFGLSRLLDSYGIPNRGILVADTKMAELIPVPFVAELRTGVAVVSRVGSGTVEYFMHGTRRSMPLSDFSEHWSGVALQAFPDEKSCEPDYARHKLMELAARFKPILLAVCLSLLVAAGVIYAGIWREPSGIMLLALDMAGVYVCWLLMLKSVKVKSRVADSVCGVLQAHGCDHVLEQKASTFFGIIGWAEVGLAYFSVTTIIMLLFPQLTGSLALVNACCLPFTVWSISYQKFMIHTWCTLCVVVQCLLWLQFICYLGGGWWHDLSLIRISLLLMVATYVAVALSLNRIKEFVAHRRPQ